MLTAAELNRMRAVAQRSMPGSAVVHSGSLISDGGGGVTEAFGPSGTLPCRVAPVNGSEREVGELISSDAEWIVTLPADSTLETDDKLVTAAGTLTVVAVRGPRSYEVTRRVEARKLA